jgi:asparagine synthase (glutamine-hydrolysing)
MLLTNAEGLAAWRYTPGLALRHPFLHRPVVEFCLQLPLHLRTDVFWPKPVLRGAMKGILPEALRMRSSGSVLAPRIQWSFRHEARQLLSILRNGVLAGLGYIEPRKIENALTSFDVFRTGTASYLYALLSLETWLSVKSGRWSAIAQTAR